MGAGDTAGRTGGGRRDRRRRAGAARDRARSPGRRAGGPVTGVAGRGAGHRVRRPHQPGSRSSPRRPLRHRQDPHDAGQGTAQGVIGVSDWHATPEVLARFATAPDAVDDLTAASLEAHLLGCGPCRRAVATAAAGAPVAAAVTWDEIADRIDRPRPTVTERLLARFVPDHVARIVAATPALRLAWLAAVS